MRNPFVSETCEDIASLSLSTIETETLQQELDFNTLLLNAVDDALFSLVGSAKKKVYSHLEKTAGIRKAQIPDRVDRFARAIEKIFGCAAYLIEIEIMKRLYRKVRSDFGHWPEKGKLAFADYIEAVRLSEKLKENIRKLC